MRCIPKPKRRIKGSTDNVSVGILSSLSNEKRKPRRYHLGFTIY